MSQGEVCTNKAHRPSWRVVQRNYNKSAFNGYKKTWSPYSLVTCTNGMCNAWWRTKAKYVDELPDMDSV